MKVSCGDKFSEVPGRSATAERRALNGTLAGGGGHRYVTKRHRWQGGGGRVGGHVCTMAQPIRKLSGISSAAFSEADSNPVRCERRMLLSDAG